MKRSIAMIMAHADDIEYSAGATLAKYLDQGYRGLYGVLSRCNSGWTVTEEEGGHYVSSLRIIPRRREEAGAAAALFGAELYSGDLLENCYTTREGLRIAPSFSHPLTVEGRRIEAGQIGEDDIPRGSLFLGAAGAGDTWEDHQALRDVADLLAAWEPELVVGQPFGNLNPDHFLAAQIVAIAWQVAARRVELGPYWLPVMPPGDGYGFPPLRPDRYVDVAGYEERCLKALACHVSQGGHLPRTQQRRQSLWKAWREHSGLDSAEAFLQVYTWRGR
jgi:LmbE family N-acetylglucosaminyl deacetylase